MTDRIRAEIEACRTATQVRKLLAGHGIEIVKDTSKDSGCFSIWVDEVTRIYQPRRGQTMKVQKWQKITMQYSGIPVYFG